MNRNGYLREQAKSAVAYNRPTIYYIAFIVLAVSACVSFITNRLTDTETLDSLYGYAQITAGKSMGISFFTSFVTAIVGFGFAVYCLKVFRGQEASFSDLGAGFSCVGKLLWLNVLEALAVFGVALAGVLAMIFLGFAPILVLLIYIALMWAVIYLLIAYSQTSYILYEYPELSAREIISESMYMMKGRKLEYIGLVFSFWLYWLLPILGAVVAQWLFPMFAGIISSMLSLYMYPLFNVALAGYYEGIAHPGTGTAA